MRKLSGRFIVSRTWCVWRLGCLVNEWMSSRSTNFSSFWVHIYRIFFRLVHKGTRSTIYLINGLQLKSLNRSNLELKLVHPIVTVLNLEIDGFPWSLNYKLYWKGLGRGFSSLLSIKSSLLEVYKFFHWLFWVSSSTLSLDPSVFLGDICLGLGS